MGKYIRVRQGLNSSVNKLLHDATRWRLGSSVTAGDFGRGGRSKERTRKHGVPPGQEDEKRVGWKIGDLRLDGACCEARLVLSKSRMKITK